MNTVQVERLLPHRFPMLLVDRVVDLVPGESVTATKAITRNEQCYRSVGAHNAGVCLQYPPTLLIESWGQTAGILATWRSPGEQDEAHATDRVMLLGGLSGVVFHRPVLPGDVLLHRARLSRALSDTAIFEGETSCDGEVVMSVERMVMAFRPSGRLLPSAG
ncbi:MULTISPECIES: 3-hydroxyacyl-ACP dehydratase FabZ family protein [unclassified Streptomyces]|uniref:3-hydroxyacyl-ACP dehydratase FabZ family protein n=1 Tax=unclassified Streptomyces TaxID=2593676 RepID=UPI0036546002